MESINIILLILIAYILYILVSKNDVRGQTTIGKKSKPKKESFNVYKRPDDNTVADDLLDDIVSWDESFNSGNAEPIELNPNFQNIQWHNDYRDVITAINNLVPDRKQLFNLPNIPVIYSEPEVGEVKNMVSDFINAINVNLGTEVPTYRNPNSGWDEAIPDPTIKSGWDKIQESLGLPVSLYEKPAPKAPIKLITVRFVQKYETEDELKYSCDIVIQKKNVDDQMILKADFVQDKRPLHDENNFFKSSIIEMKVWIENVYVVGYLSQYGDDSTKQYDGDDKKYYDYNKLEYNNLVDPKYVQKVLMEKYRQRNEEMEQRTALLDEEGQNFHRELPHIYDFSNIRGTQTIFDDMNYHKTFI